MCFYKILDNQKIAATFAYKQYKALLRYGFFPMHGYWTFIINKLYM